MSITSIGMAGTTGPSNVPGAGHRRGETRKAAFDAVAQTLGMTTVDLRSSLKSSQTIATLAAGTSV